MHALYGKPHVRPVSGRGLHRVANCNLRMGMNPWAGLAQRFCPRVVHLHWTMESVTSLLACAAWLSPPFGSSGVRSRLPCGLDDAPQGLQRDGGFQPQRLLNHLRLRKRVRGCLLPRGSPVQKQCIARSIHPLSHMDWFERSVTPGCPHVRAT